MTGTLAAERLKQHSRTPPPVPLAVANISRKLANETRAEWLIGVSQEVLTVIDVLAHAASPAGRPLRRISLLQLLGAQVGWGSATTQRTLDRLRVALRCTTGNEVMTVGWLLDNRTSGRRLLALTTALGQEARSPWAAWPFTALGSSG